MAWEPTAASWAARLRSSATWPRDVSLGQGSARWMRIDLASLAVWQAWRRRDLSLQVDAGPSLALLTARGDEVPGARRDWSMAWGGMAGARTILKTKVPLFVDLRGSVWANAPRLVVVATGEPLQSASLGAFVAIISVGISFHL